MGEVAVDRLTKTFADGDAEIVAVDELTIDIEDGEFLVLVGPSGCGKSTTLRCLAGLEEVTSGEIRIEGERVTDRKPKDRDIAMVFQNYALYPHMTARENMSFGLRMTTDLPDDEIDSRVERSAEMMGIENLLEKKPRELSGGQQQRVALGRAIVREPAVFLMDEPLSNLDAKLRTTMRTELQDLQQRLGVTTVYVTHDQTEAMTMGDRIAILNDGELQQIGTPLECYHEPANRFVAGFIGSPSMNFVDVDVETRPDGTTELVHETFRYPLSNDRSDSVPSSVDRLVVGIRPEDVKPTSRDDERAIPVEISVTEPLGDATYVYFELGGETYTASVAGGVRTDAGERVDVSFPEDRIHLFDAETGETIANRSAPVDGINSLTDRQSGTT